MTQADSDVAVSDQTGDQPNGEKTGSDKIDCNEVLHLLPHRYPFLLVDCAHSYVAMKSIIGRKCVTINEPFFPGHFPERPVMPGVLVIEALAQTGAILMSKSMNVDVKRNAVFFMAIDNARFRAPVLPGDVLEMPVQAVFARRGVFKFKGEAHVNGQLVAEAEFAAKLVEVA